ncbi:MAG: NAD(P)/FAD-dependent oxidoreductase [Gemmatimonadota bacterium]
MTARDLVVIGTGSAASTVATACAESGWSVAIVDSRPYGGTCQLRGCDPKKVLVGAAHVVDWVERMEGKGVAGGAEIAWPRLIRFKRSFTDPVPEQREARFREAGIATHHGHARMVGPTAVEVGAETLEARHVVIATGARPRTLALPGADLLTTSDEFLDLEDLPDEITFVGGGYISFEFAHIAARAGSSVTILHRGERPLEEFDPDLVESLVSRSRGMGIEIVLGAEVEEVAREGNRLVVRSREQETRADLVVHGAGRDPDIDDLDLEAAGIERDERGIAVNGFMQSVSNPAVYAAGDCAAGGAPLTPVASYEGRIVARNLLEGNHARADYTGIPTVAFTLPPLARSGLLEEEARAQGLEFEMRHESTEDWYSSRRVGESASGYKVLVEAGSGKVLGAHLLGWEAEEVINLFAFAIRHEIPASDLRATPMAYPTHISDLGYMVGR